MRDYIVAGVPLRDPLGQWFIDYSRSSLVTELSRALAGSQPYGYHGSPSPKEGFFGTGRETVVLNIVGNNKDDHNALLRGFLGLFGRPTLTITSAPQRSALSGGSARYGQTFSVSADLIRLSTFRLVGSPAVERVDEAASRVTFILENVLAFWSSQNYYTSSPLVLAGSTGTLDLKPTLADSQAPITDGLIRIKGPISAAGSVIVRDRTTTRNVKYTAVTALAASEYVVIDIFRLTARLQTTDSWSTTTGTDVSNRIDVSGPGVMGFSPGDVVAFPDSSDYAATIVASGHTNGSTAVETRLRRSYLS